MKTQSGMSVTINDNGQIDFVILSLELGNKFIKEFGTLTENFISKDELIKWVNKQDGYLFIDKITKP